VPTGLSPRHEWHLPTGWWAIPVIILGMVAWIGIVVAVLRWLG
jgi:hypothetical protein